MSKKTNSRTIINSQYHNHKKDQKHYNNSTRPPSSEILHPPLQVNCRLFDKKFRFRPNADWRLPDESQLFTTGKFVYEPLEKLKQELNFTKNKLNDYDLQEWNQHTTRRNPANEIVANIRRSGYEFVTNAWCKMYEILNTYPVVDPKQSEVKSVSLCEAPGGFITALNHYLKQNNATVTFTWTATTLNPYYEGNKPSNTIFDDRFILPSLDQWYFGVDFTGNLMNADNIAGLQKRFAGVDLVTADGSIDCHDQPEEQELVVAKLHITEAIVALKVLKSNGSFVLKMFTFFEDCSINLMYLLNCCFREVNVFKPATSKGGNSEVYVVCLGFKGSVCEQFLNKVLTEIMSSPNNMFPFNVLPPSFLVQLTKCSEFFKEQQETVIENNIHFYKKETDEELEKLRLLRDIALAEYYERYNLRRIDDSFRLFPKSLYSVNYFNLNPRGHEGSFSDRQSQKAKSTVGKLAELEKKCSIYLGVYPLEYRFTPIPLPVADELIPELTVGQKIIRLYSTKFLLGPLIQYFNDLLDVITVRNTEMGRNGQRRCIHPNRINADHKKSRTIIIVVPKTLAELIMVNYDCYEKQLFYDLIEELLKTTGQAVIIENLVLLSQFMVGFIYFLKVCVFEEVACDRSGRIEMKGYKHGWRKQVLTLKSRVIDQIRSVQSEQAVLGFVKIQKLFYNVEFYNQVVDYNVYTVLKLCDFYLKDLSKE